MKNRIAKFLKSSTIGKMVYPVAQWVYHLYSIPTKRRRLQKHGVQMLIDLHKVFTENGIDYHLDFGSLLGVIREHDFIKHDDDIDLTIVDRSPNPARILKIMLDNGFGFIHAMRAANHIVEFSVQKNKLSVDFFFYLPVNRPHKVGVCGVYFDSQVQYPSPDLNNYRVWFFPDDTKTKVTQFKGVDIRIPDNPEALLEFEYGPGWRTPIKGWNGDCMKDRYEIMPDYAKRITDVNDVLAYADS